MAKILWDEPGTHVYETGIRNCVLFVQDQDGNYQNGVAWSGLVTVTEKSESDSPLEFWADDVKYAMLFPPVELNATVEAYAFPEDFLPCIGIIEAADGIFISQQARSTFAICYKTTAGNDILSDDYGYKLHIIYGCTAAPSEKPYKTTSTSPEAILFSWDLSTMPVEMEGYKNTSNIVLDSTLINPSDMSAIEKILYGTDIEDSRLLLPNEIKHIIENGFLINEEG